MLNLLKKYSKPLVGVCSFAFAFIAGQSVFAVESATSTLDTIMGVIIGTTVGLATTLFTEYWPYVLVFGIITSMIVVFTRFLKIKK